ncbi:acyl CoA binding protein-domain-containing protein [Astrocystis sublimbata]|nr:acyl CoA binding protein-domain-containing protein [Astrocystis sublimbata]
MSDEYTLKEKAAFAKYDGFEKAAKREVKQLLQLPSNEDLLELYALYKIGIDDDINVAFKDGRPNFFDMKGRKKFDAWSEKNDEALTQDQAVEHYIARVEGMKKTYGFDADKEPATVGR